MGEWCGGRHCGSFVRKPLVAGSMRSPDRVLPTLWTGRRKGINHSMYSPGSRANGRECCQPSGRA
ncbi:hypothetical protein FM103_04520 [Corynebacterium xerosis]|nr:hypothetical protein FM103_04520 [Corynebacterium xerosis]